MCASVRHVALTEIELSLSSRDLRSARINLSQRIRELRRRRVELCSRCSQFCNLLIFGSLRLKGIEHGIDT